MPRSQTPKLQVGDYSPRHITAAVLKEVSTWPPPAKWKSLRCTDIKGFVLRHRPGTGSLSLYAEYGRGKARSVGRVSDILNDEHPDTLTKARKECRRLQGLEIDSGAVSGAASLKRKQQSIPTFAEFIDEYAEWLEDDPNHMEPGGTVNRIRAVYSGAPFWCERMCDLDPADVTRVEHRRLKKLKPSTVIRDTSVLKAMLGRYERLKGRTTGFVNPLKGYRTAAKIDKGEKGRRAFTDAEITTLLQALGEREEMKRRTRVSYNEYRVRRSQPPLKSLEGIFVDYLKPAVILSLETGIRRGECFSLKWQAVNLDRDEITIRGRDAKSGTTRTVYLTARSKKTLRDWWMQQGQPKTGFVFSHPDGKSLDNLRNSFDPLMKKAGIEKRNSNGSASWHCLRHTFGTNMVRKTDLATVRDLMGHSDIATTALYLHSDEHRKREAIEHGAVL